VTDFDDSPTVYTSDEQDSQAENPAQQPSAGAAANQDPAPPDAGNATQAGQLADSGANEPAEKAKFLPLGVFTLAPKGQEQASALVQLALGHDGKLRGTYYDLLSDQDHSVTGAVDKKTQRAAFRFGPQGKVVFETSLANLTQDSGSVAVHYENGETRGWTLARYAGEPTEENPQGGRKIEAGEESPAEETSPVDEKPASEKTGAKEGERPTEIPVRVEPDTEPASSRQE
jgi:hypothetical protein